MKRASIAVPSAAWVGVGLACVAALYGAARYFTQERIQPLSLASADINLDGFPDLITGHARSGGGVVTLRLGNPEAFAPTASKTIQAIASGQYPAPFVRETTVLETPEAPEFLATGDFDRDGHLDILTAARGSRALYVLAGDDQHRFGTPRGVPLPGRLTTMTTGQKTQTDDWPDVVVGIVGEAGPALMVYQSKHGVLADAVPASRLPAAATELALGRLDEDRWMDMAIVAGDRLFVLHGADEEGMGEPNLLEEDEEGGTGAGYLEPIDLPFGVNAVALSDFIWDRDARMELAVAGVDGPVRILARGPLDTRSLTAPEVLARRQLVEAVRRGERPSSDLTPARPYLAPTWQVAETIGAVSSQRAGGAHPLLVSTLGSGRQAHDLLIPDSGVVAALPMRVGVHAVPGLVVLRPDDSEPVVQIQPQSHVAFNVNTAADTDDAAAGNGTCGDSGGNCSLRAAVQEANAHAGADMITFSPALNGVPIQLTQTGDDNTAGNGDLDINSDITIVGNGAANTIIQGSSNAAFTGNMGDKIFGINQDGTFSTLNVSISGLTVRFTRNNNPTVGTFTETGGALDIFLTGTGAMPGPTTTITNCTFDSNANQNSYGGAINIDSGDLMGGTNIFRGTVQITGTTISNNDTLNVGGAATGGGINLFADRHNVSFTNTTITGNQTSANIGSNGGGLNIRHSFGGTITFNTNTISNNISGSDGGGILIAGVGGQTVNITGGSITGNTAQGTGASADGGGLFNANPVGSTTLSGVTISNNTATAGADARGGGIEDGANSPLTINNCVITGNSSDSGGGVATTNAFVNQLTTITNSTISGNSATTAGGGLFILSGSMMANLNRIVNNTAPAGSGIAQTGGTANVENNWWGCDGFPSAAGCQTGSGTFDADPRIDLRLLPASATLMPAGTQTFTANVSQNTNGVAINPVVLNGLTITFSGGGLGSVAPGSAALSNLMAGTLFTASSTCPSPNTGSVSATLDNGTQNSSMTVQLPPAISACPANQTLNTDPGTCTALGAFTPPTATAGCPVPVVMTRIGATSITSPHAFPVGTSTVTGTASNGIAPDASCSFTVTVNDTQNPAITCPANINSTENPPGSGSAVVTYAAPVGTDACPGATTVQTAGLASGSAFPVGVTTNSFGVTDAAGNMATCSFTVTVTTPPDLSITKSHTGNFTQGQTGATYTLTATNAGGMPTSGIVTLTDNVPTGLVATAAAGTGWACTISPAPVTCTRSDPLAPGTSYPPVTLTVNVEPNALPSVTNTATIAGGGDVNTTNNTATDVTTILPGPDLTISKSHAGNFIQGQTGAQFTVTVTNSGGSPASGTVTLVDSVPTGLIPTAASGTGWNCGVTGAMVNCTRSDPLAPGASYGPVTITVSVAPNAPPSVTNIVTLSGGGDVNTTNNTATDVATILPGPDLTISKSHVGSFLQGQVGAQFTVTVTNSGGSPTSGPVTLTGSLPAALTPTAAAGAGWVCNIAGAAVNCSRSDPLAPGASYAAVTITVNVAPNAPPSVTNTATVAGGGDVNSTNNTATDIVTIGPGPDLIISKSHSGSFQQGQTGAQFTVSVTNNGGSPTSGSVTLTDTLPAGLTPTAATGAGWTCGVAGAMVSCSRSDPLAPGASYGPVTITVNVEPNAPPSVTNTATIAGGGDVNSTNNTATDVVVISPGSDLTISKSHAGNFTQGQTGAQFTVSVTNSGASPTSGAVTLTDNLPAGLTPTGASGTGWTCGVAGAAVTCSRSDPLAPGASYGPVTITVNVEPNAPPSVTNTATIAGGGDVNTTNNAATDLVTLSPGSDLTISKRHAGNLLQGQTGAQFSVSVTNSGTSPTSGAVTLTDNLPAGLTPTAASGAGWTCVVAGVAVNCSRSDALAPGASYGPVTITADVAVNAPPSVTNTATIAGGGDANPANNTATDLVTIDLLLAIDLAVTKTDGRTAYLPGAPILYTIVVTNAGPSSANGFSVVDAVPAAIAGVTAACAVTGTGSCGVNGSAGNSVSFTGASLSPGRGNSLTLTVRGTVSNDATADLVNTAIVTAGAGSTDPNPANNTATDTDVPISIGLPTEVAGFFAYHPAFMGGVRVAVGDVTGDGRPDIITAAGATGGPHVRAFDMAGGGAEVASFYAYDPAFTGGVRVAVGDVNSDSVGEIVTGPGASGGPHVRAFDMAGGGAEVASFYAYNPAFTGGVNVAVGDVNGDGVDDIVTGAGASGGPHVRAFSLAGGGLAEIASFFAYDPLFTGGVSVAAGDVNGDGVDDIVTGAGASGGPHVRAFTMATGALTEVASFFAYDPLFTGGINVAVGDVNGDGVGDIVTGAGASGGPHVRVFSLVSGAALQPQQRDR